jgi:Zn-dependent M28 family amino/carboxypeptidase
MFKTVLTTLVASSISIGLASSTAQSQLADDISLRACESAGPMTEAVLLECVSAHNAYAHLQVLQTLSDQNGGNRAAGTTGHELSANYIAQKLLAAGYLVQLVPFDFLKFTKSAPAVFEQVSPTKIVFADEKEFNVMSYSPSGNVTAATTAVDFSKGEGNKSTSGCEADDFKDFPRGHIALLQRGACPFSQKAKNAQAAGAVGAVISNQGDSASKMDLFSGTLAADSGITIPVYAISYPLAMELIERGDLALQMNVATKTEKLVSHNVIAETKTGNPDNVVMIGSHLDGVDAGPGINDNGSGSAAILEVAIKMQKVKSNNKLRFAWWSAEELGLVGSTKYVESLSVSEKTKIALYLNFDMIASKNYQLGVYDGDGSAHKTPGPDGSAAIEQLFHMYYSLKGPASVEVPLNGRSDYAAFASAGIPVGGTFTGAEGTKTEEEAKLYGGKAGEAYDACYHKACDTIDNISMEALEVNTDAIAYMALTYGHSTASVVKKKADLVFSDPMAKAHDHSVVTGCHSEAFLQ